MITNFDVCRHCSLPGDASMVRAAEKIKKMVRFYYDS
jgi:hypothetical protein